MLPVKKYVIDLIDSRVESFDLRQQMSNDITCKATNDEQGANVKAEEVLLAHFLGLAYPNTPATIAPKMCR